MYSKKIRDECEDNRVEFPPHQDSHHHPCSNKCALFKLISFDLLQWGEEREPSRKFSELKDSLK